MKPEPGKLLVATPVLRDPNFFRTVVLLLAHGEEGSLGVVLNRPAETALGEVLPDWAPKAAAPATVFVGGPVAPESALCLASRDAGGEPEGWTTVTGAAGVLDMDAGAAGAAGLARLRVFAGYAGWSPGQLAEEIATGSWYVLDCAPEDPFSVEPLELWKRVLRRQRGELALVASCPPDPSLN